MHGGDHQDPRVTSAASAATGPARLARTPQGPPRWLLTAAGWISLLLAPALSPASAQYISPGAPTPVTGIPPHEQLADSYSAARWSLGALRLEPWLGIRDAAYVSNSGTVDAGDDFTATAGAGLRAYLKTGPKVFWSAHAQPEYVWWQDFEQKRRLNGNYGLGLFGYFNRLTLELSRQRIEKQTFFSTEVQELTSSRQDVSNLALALALGARLELFASGRLLEIANQEEENSTFFLLDRQEETLELGVRYRSPGGLWVELAHEERTNDFADRARNLSSSGTAERLGLGLESSNLEIRFNLTATSLDPEPGSEFRPTDESTGYIDLLWRPSRRLDLLAYARRSLSFSVDSRSSHLLAERQGLRLDLGSRLGILSLFGELGDEDFEPLTGASRRLDDVTVLGAELQLKLGRLIYLVLRAGRTEYDSNLDEFDREVTTVGLTVELGALRERLSLGNASGGW